MHIHIYLYLFISTFIYIYMLIISASVFFERDLFVTIKDADIPNYGDNNIVYTCFPQLNVVLKELKNGRQNIFD